MIGNHPRASGQPQVPGEAPKHRVGDCSRTPPLRETLWPIAGVGVDVCVCVCVSILSVFLYLLVHTTLFM